MTNRVLFLFTIRSDDLTESLESEMQRAFESIKLGQNSENDLERNESLDAAQNGSQSISEAHFETPVSKVEEIAATRKQTNGHSPYFKNESQPPSQNGANQSTIKRSLDRDEVRVMQKVLGNEVMNYNIKLPF